jgi:CRP/FNR family transcriptional regulator
MRDQKAAATYSYCHDAAPPPTSYRGAIERLAPPEEYPAKVEIFQQGSTACEVFFIDQGFVKLSCLSEDGKELIVGMRSCGAMLGSASVMLGRPHPVTATALTCCLLRRIPLVMFFELARTDAQFGWHLHQVHSREVYDQASHLVALRYLSARKRLEHLLWQVIYAMKFDTDPTPDKISLPLKFLDLARLIGITAEHFSRVLRQMEEESVIRRENGALVILNPQELYHSV